MNEDILSLLEYKMPTFSKGQRRIATLIRENYDKTAFLTASQLGKQAGVSESTVVRFAMELGYEGYPQMQKAMQETVLNTLSSMQRMGVAQDRMGDRDVISTVLHNDAETLALQTKIWAAQEQNMEQANDYAMLLIRNSPADMMAWDTLGRVVAVREGADAALEVLERVGEVSETCSSLFEFLGDLYSQTGDKDKAVQSYKRAIELSDDGLVVVPYIEKKLRKMK